LGLFYSKNDKNPLLLWDEKMLVDGFFPRDEFYFDGFIPAGIFHLDWPNFIKILKGNLIGLKGIPLGKNPAYAKRKTPALFLDRDGILNEDIGHLSDPSLINFYEDVMPLILEANRRDMPVVVLTNQSGVGRNLFTLEEMEEINHVLNLQVIKNGGRIDAWHFNVYHPMEGVGGFKRESLLRKPGPGMAQVACEKFPIDFARSFMIGDKISDELQIPGLKSVLIKRNYDLSQARSPVYKTFQDAFDLIFKNDQDLLF
jgi:D-glycero-D-manno-heptose 1,7-bisphosphate phosphatase